MTRCCGWIRNEKTTIVKQKRQGRGCCKSQTGMVATGQAKFQIQSGPWAHRRWGWASRGSYLGRAREWGQLSGQRGWNMEEWVLTIQSTLVDLSCYFSRCASRNKPIRPALGPLLCAVTLASRVICSSWWGDDQKSRGHHLQSSSGHTYVSGPWPASISIMQVSIKWPSFPNLKVEHMRSPYLFITLQA